MENTATARTEDPNHPVKNGLTAKHVESATTGVDNVEVNLKCSDQECYLAVNEFELLASPSPESGSTASIKKSRKHG